MSHEDFRQQEGKNKIDLVIGGPPCQGFSLAGKRDVKDKRNYLYKKYLDLVLTIKLYLNNAKPV